MDQATSIEIYTVRRAAGARGERVRSRICRGSMNALRVLTGAPCSHERSFIAFSVATRCQECGRAGPGVSYRRRSVVCQTGSEGPGRLPQSRSDAHSHCKATSRIGACGTRMGAGGVLRDDLVEGIARNQRSRQFPPAEASPSLPPHLRLGDPDFTDGFALTPVSPTAPLPWPGRYMVVMRSGQCENPSVPGRLINTDGTSI